MVGDGAHCSGLPSMGPLHGEASKAIKNPGRNWQWDPCREEWWQLKRWKWGDAACVCVCVCELWQRGPQKEYQIIITLPSCPSVPCNKPPVLLLPAASFRLLPGRTARSQSIEGFPASVHTENNGTSSAAHTVTLSLLFLPFLLLGWKKRTAARLQRGRN